MREGFYRVDFTGLQGWGMALIAFDTGRVVGTDTESGMYDGTFEFNTRTELLDATVKFCAGKAATLVQGVTINAGDTFNISVSFPREAEGVVAQAQTDFGPVNLMITFIRPFPD